MAQVEEWKGERKPQAEGRERSAPSSAASAGSVGPTWPVRQPGDKGSEELILPSPSLAIVLPPTHRHTHTHTQARQKQLEQPFVKAELELYRSRQPRSDPAALTEETRERDHSN